MSADAPYVALAGEVLRRLPTVTGRPLLVGIAGAVAVGKSTTAARLRDALAEHGVGTDVVCTDCFLHDNTVLAARELLMRKGFPESFDTAAMEATLRRLRAGDVPVDVPVYSHQTYDIVPGERVPVGAGARVVVVEGVNALQSPADGYYDVSVYVDADEADVRRWFVDRFLVLCEASDGTDFYAMFGGMTAEARAAVAHGAWDGINGPNLREHIAPTRRHATLVLRKTADHTASLASP